MELGDQDIRHVAKLARLRLNPGELERVRRDLNRVLAYVEQLQQLSLEGIEPTMHVGQSQAPLRPDRAGTSLSVNEATANAPEVQGGMFKVPRIMESGGDAGE